ncbi:MAG TPA: PilZ domain-containing protein [Rhodocyclaceae bacterium]|nr:PilZ domain-containing protein [Rhodocyclaceae bacterium]
MSLSSNENPDDRRHFWRAAFHSPVQISNTTGTVEGELIDLSLKGALVELDKPTLKVGERCKVHLALSTDAAINMATVVSHVEGCKVGLRSEHMDLDSITHLRRLVELNAGDPDLLDRELSALLGS